MLQLRFTLTSIIINVPNFVICVRIDEARRQLGVQQTARWTDCQKRTHLFAIASVLLFLCSIFILICTLFLCYVL